MIKCVTVGLWCWCILDPLFQPPPPCIERNLSEYVMKTWMTVCDDGVRRLAQVGISTCFAALMFKLL